MSDQNDGVCDSSGVCICQPGFNGTTCTKISNETSLSCLNCVNGVCDSSNECICNNIWYGESCDKSKISLVIGIIIAVIFVIALIVASIVVYRNRYKLPCNLNFSQKKQNNGKVDKKSGNKYINTFRSPSASAPNSDYVLNTITNHEQLYVNSPEKTLEDRAQNHTDYYPINTDGYAVPKLPNSSPPNLRQIKSEDNIDNINQDENYYYPIQNDSKF